MKKLILPIMAMLMISISSCSLFEDKVLPQAKAKAAEKITEAIVETGECKAVEAVRADVNDLLKIESDESMVVKALGLQAPEGSQQQNLVSEICKSAASLAVPVLLRKGVPEKWDCELNDLSSKVSELAMKACGNLGS